MAQPLAASPIANEEARDVANDDIIVLRGATWADYQRLLELRGERRRQHGPTLLNNPPPHGLRDSPFVYHSQGRHRQVSTKT